MLTQQKLSEIKSIAMKAVMDAYGTTEGCVKFGCCGFAWVDVYGFRKNDKNPDRHALEAAGFKHSSYDKAFKLWVHDFGQFIDMKETFAYAYAKELQKLGYECYAGSRLD